MSIGFYNFTDLHNQEFRNIVKERIGKIIDDGSFVEGPYNTSFETDFAKKQNVKNCLLVANGTDALEISLLTYDIKPGDKVGVPGITFYATVEAVLNVGAVPVFIDIDPQSGLMSAESLLSVLSSHDLKCVMPVHIYGLPCDMKAIEDICYPKNIKIVEDAAQAQGTITYSGPVGSGKNLTTFSFYPTKNLSAFGDAGGILTHDDAIADKIKVIRNHGRGSNELLGRNSRCDHIQASVQDAKLVKVDDYNQARKNVAGKYFEALKDCKIKLVPRKFIETSSWHLFPAQCESVEQRENLQAHLKEKGIASTPFYDQALSQMNQLKNYEGEDVNAKNFAGKTICLPIHPFITDENITEISNEVISFFKN